MKIVEGARVAQGKSYPDQLVVYFPTEKTENWMRKGVRSLVFHIAGELEELREAAGLDTVVQVANGSNQIEVDTNGMGHQWRRMISAALEKCNVPELA